MKTSLASLGIIIAFSAHAYELNSFKQVYELVNRDPDIRKAASLVREKDANITTQYHDYIPEILFDTSRNLKNSKNIGTVDLGVNLLNRTTELNGIRLARWEKEEAEYKYLDIKNEKILQTLVDFMNLQKNVLMKYEI